MQFEWDENKNVLNKFKHGVSFELASLAFHDPFLISVLDKRHDYFEERWLTIGKVKDITLYVAHTIEEDDNGEEIIRIISARKATSSEEWHYYSYQGNDKRN